MANPNPKPNYAAQGANAEQAGRMAQQSDAAHTQIQQNAAQMQGAGAPAPVGPEQRAPQAVNLTPNDMPQGSPQGDPEDMAFLHADPEAPADLGTIMQQAQQQQYSRDTPVPTRLLRYLPILRQMAYDPSAPASVQAFYRHVVDSIERRRTQ